MLILQRYYFESESQQIFIHNLIPFCCCLSYKDTILKANHSVSDRILPFLQLLLILQRYYFESESQLSTCIGLTPHSCCLSYKDTILKANHSTSQVLALGATAVAYPTKILFWKRITALFKLYCVPTLLLLILQRYYFESESQQT